MNGQTGGRLERGGPLSSSTPPCLGAVVAGGFAEGRYRIFGDFAHQAIVDAADETLEDLQARCPTAFIGDLAVNCRNTPRVLPLARGVDVEESGRIARADDGLDPVARFYRDAEHQCDLLGEALDRLRDEGFTGPQVVVPSPHSHQACAAAEFSGMAGAAAGARVPTGARDDVAASGGTAADGDAPPVVATTPSADDATEARRPAWRDRLAPLAPPGGHEPELRSGKTKYASFYRFQGVESRAVVLTDVDRLQTEHERDLFYIGATRATQRLIVLAHQRLRPVFRKPTAAPLG